MLNYDEEHKAADLSPIKSKLKKFWKACKEEVAVIIVGGVGLSIAVVFGISLIHLALREPSTPTYPNRGTAIVTQGDNALLIDINDYHREKSTNMLMGTEYGDLIYLTLEDGSTYIGNVNNTQIIKGEDSHEKAETIAQTLIGENGTIVDYDYDGDQDADRVK